MTIPWWVIALVLGVALIAVSRMARAAPWMRERDREAIERLCAAEGLTVSSAARHGPKTDLWVRRHLGIRIWDRCYDVVATAPDGGTVDLIVHIPFQIEPSRPVSADIVDRRPREGPAVSAGSG